MDSDRDKWNSKFKERTSGLMAPEPYLLRNENHLVEGSLLDVASGDGRNALYFAKKGFSVSALDLSDVALQRLEGFAVDAGVNVELINMDLDEADFRGLVSESGGFDNIIMTYFKPAPELWGMLSEILKPGGSLVYVTFNIKHHELNGFPKEFCLQPEELVNVSSELVCKKYESFIEDGKYLDGYVFLKQAVSTND